MTRQQKILVYSFLSLTGVSYFVYRGIRRKQSFNELMAIISKSSGGTSSKTKLRDALEGKLEEKISIQNPNKNYFRLSDGLVQSYSSELNDAMSGWGTNENKIESVLSSLKDKIQVSQIASYYKSVYNKTLYTHLLSELSTTDFNNIVVQQITKIPDVRWKA